MPIDPDFPKNHQAIGKHKLPDGEHYHFVWGPGRSDAETATKPEVQEAYKTRGEEYVPLGVHGTMVAVDWDSTEFREWFSWSNQVLKNSPGFISRKLIKGKDGSYVAIVEHSGYDTFTAMHSSSEHRLVHEKALSLFSGTPKPEFFEVVST